MEDEYDLSGAKRGKFFVKDAELVPPVHQAKQQKRFIGWTFFFLPLVAGFLLRVAGAFWTPPHHTLSAGLVLADYVFWGVPALIVGVYASRISGHLSYQRIALAAFAASLMYTALGCLTVTMAVIDSGSLDYCLSRSERLVLVLPACAVVAALICCWIENAGFRHRQP